MGILVDQAASATGVPSVPHTRQTFSHRILFLLVPLVVMCIRSCTKLSILAAAPRYPGKYGSLTVSCLTYSSLVPPDVSHQARQSFAGSGELTGTCIRCWPSDIRCQNTIDSGSRRIPCLQRTAPAGSRRPSNGH